MKIRFFLLSLLLILFFPFSVTSTPIFYYDAESDECNTPVPAPPFWPPYWPPESGDQNLRGRVVCDLSPQGTKHFHWSIAQNQTHYYTEIHPRGTDIVVGNVIGRTFYLAWKANIARINEQDVYHTDRDSFDKGVEIIGNGIRWLVARGYHSDYTPLPAHTYSMFGGNPNYHLNPEIEHYDYIPLNQNGYSLQNPIILQYDHWYNVVMVLKIASDHTGYFAVYINGIKIQEYNNIQTAVDNNANIWRLQVGGTIAQPYYDAPPHYQKYDALMLTEDWQDIIDWGYLQDPEQDNIPPSTPITPQAAAVSPYQINISWVATTDNVGVTGYRIYRNGTYLANTTDTSYQDKGLSPLTTYIYQVSAYDAAGNEGNRSAIVSSTTPAAPTIFINESWDSGTPPADWPCKNIPAACTIQTFNEWHGRTWDCTLLGGNASGLSTTIYHSPPRSYYMEREQNVNYSCNIYKYFSGNPTKMYLRFYAYFPYSGTNGWNQWTYDNTQAYDDSNHWIHINTAITSTDKISIDLLDVGHGGGWPPPCWTAGVDAAFLNLKSGRTEFNLNSAYCGFNVYANLDRWVCFEFMFDRVNNKYALWIDGIQRVGSGGQGVEQSFATVTKFDALILDSFRSGGFPYIAHGSSYYIDDIVISDSYIGCEENCIHKSETPPCNGCVETMELNAFIYRWKVNNLDVTIRELIEAISLWKRGNCI